VKVKEKKHWKGNQKEGDKGKTSLRLTQKEGGHKSWVIGMPGSSRGNKRNPGSKKSPMCNCPHEGKGGVKRHGKNDKWKTNKNGESVWGKG